MSCIIRLSDRMGIDAVLVGRGGAVLHAESSGGAEQRLGPSLVGTGRAAAAAAPLAIAGDEMVVVLGPAEICCPVHDRTALAVPLHDRSGSVQAALELE